jgi:hypothetical protein
MGREIQIQFIAGRGRSGSQGTGREQEYKTQEMEIRGNTYYWSKYEIRICCSPSGRMVVRGKVDRQLGGVSENCCFFFVLYEGGGDGENGERM